MSEEAARSPFWRWLKLSLRIVVYLVLALFALAIFPVSLFLQFFGLLLFGWVPYLRDVLPRASFNAEIATEAFITLVLGVFGLHIVLLWWVRRRDGLDAQWRPVWTMKITTGVLLLFATSIAATGIVHQVGWLLRAEQITYDANRGRMTRELSNLKQVALALRIYADDFGGKYPQELDSLVPEYLPMPELLFSTMTVNDPSEAILYFPPAPEKASVEWIVLAGPQPGRRNQKSAVRVVAYCGGTASVIKESEFQQRLTAQRGGVPLP